MSESDIESRAAKLYHVYCWAVDGKGHDGKTLPTWSEFAIDPTKVKQAKAWREVARYTLTGES